MSLLYLNVGVERMLATLAASVETASKILLANQLLDTSKLVRNCCRECDQVLKHWPAGKFNGFKSVDECADLLHDTALGVLEPGHWRAKNLVLVPMQPLLFAKEVA